MPFGVLDIVSLAYSDGERMQNREKKQQWTRKRERREVLTPTKKKKKKGSAVLTGHALTQLLYSKT